MNAKVDPESLKAAVARITGSAPGTVTPTGFTWARDFPAVHAPRMLVDKLFEAGTLAEIFGDSNTGKSTLALDMALRIASGAPWRGRRTAKGIVFYLALESAAGARRRVAAHCKRFDTALGQLLFADVSVAVQLLEQHDVNALVAAIRAAESEAGEKCVLVVVDTLARAIAPGDESKTMDMGAFVRSCDMLRTGTGSAVLVVHHSGKDPTKGARGSGSLRAAVDTEIEVTGQANPRQAKVTKQRDLPSGDVFAFDLEPVDIGIDDETGEAITACVVAHRDDVPHAAIVPKGKAVASILRALRAQQDAHSKTGEHGPLIWTLEDMRLIGRNLGQHRNTAREAVDRLVMSGLMVPTIGGHRLTEAGQ